MAWKPSVAIVGVGGMGALFGSMLQSGGLAVTLIDTNAEHVHAIRSQGLKIIGFARDRTERIAVTPDASTVTSADVVQFQYKAHGSRDAAQAIQHLIGGGAVAISFQNGLGNEEAISEVIGKDNVLDGLTTMAGRLLGPGIIRDFSRVPSYIGELGGGISARIDAVGYHCQLHRAGLDRDRSPRRYVRRKYRGPKSAHPHGAVVLGSGNRRYGCLGGEPAVFVHDR